VQRHSGKGLHLRLPGPAVDPLAESALGKKVSMLCELPESSDALFQSYKPKLRSQIRKAEKNGLSASVTSGPEAIGYFYRVFADNMHRLGSPVHSLRWFQDLQASFGDRLKVGLVYSEEKVIGAGIILINGVRASIPWASTLADYNRLAPNMLLYWTLLAHVTDAGCRVFDFGRSTPGEGTYRFKEQWGAVPYELRWQDLTPEGEPAVETAPSGQGSKVRALVESAWQRLPLSMANLLGPSVRKYISL
jgi:FemAB-related protein (PEP-CTERM system-associated)